MLEVSNLNFSYTKKYQTLKNIYFKANQKELTIILGSNGVGKSTLFNLILGNLKPKSGDIKIDGKSIVNLHPNKRAKLVSFVPQEWSSPFNYKALDIVLMGLASKISLFSNPSKDDIFRATNLFELLDIKHLINSNIKELSGGQRQMILLCRALITQSPVLLLDEITSHLDLKNQIKILSILQYLAKHKDISILSTLHDPNLASLYADYIIALKDGTIYVSGRKDEVINQEILENLYETPIEMSFYNGSYIVRGKKIYYDRS
ncbi:ABC transporter ATP-binding protein [Campylobacter sputorum]|uniref:ABC transporter ATP-binding protein n=1 Tax=Campylobacter sputorum TaxID=206 RepID=UPI00053BE0C4|nr:ABC transporter ATP-binding protein [Campylobacter sputorum]